MRSTRARIRGKFHRIPRLRFGGRQNLTSFAGLVLFQALFGVLRLRERLRDAVGRSTGVYGLTVVFLLLVVHLLVGFRRLRGLNYYSDDPLVARILGLRRLPSLSTVSRTLARATVKQIAGVRHLTRDLVLDRLVHQAPRRITLDYDGSVQSTSGHAEGTAVGFNKKKKGARSYWPMFATVAQTSQFFDMLHRPGNVNDIQGAPDFMSEHVDLVRIRLGTKVILEARWDSAFFSEEVVGCLDSRDVEFTGSVPFKRFAPLKQAIVDR